MEDEVESNQRRPRTGDELRIIKIQQDLLRRAYHEIEAADLRASLYGANLFGSELLSKIAPHINSGVNHQGRDLRKIAQHQEELLDRSFKFLRDAEVILKLTGFKLPIDGLLGEIILEVPDLSEEFQTKAT